MEKLIKFKPEFRQDKLFEMKIRLNLLKYYSSIFQDWMFKILPLKGMKKCFSVYISVVILLITLFPVKSNSLIKQNHTEYKAFKDTIGFAQYSWQMDSLMARIRQNRME